MTLPTQWVSSEGNTSVWGISQWNARVRLADIKVHAKMNGIDHNQVAYMMTAAPDLYHALECMYNLASEMREALEQHTDIEVPFSTFHAANKALHKARGVEA